MRTRKLTIDTTGLPPLTKKETILDEAARITSQDRRKEYGPVATSFTRIALMWEAILGVSVSPRQVALCMIALKISRDCAGAKRDNLVDIAGYARTAEMLEDGE